MIIITIMVMIIIRPPGMVVSGGLLFYCWCFVFCLFLALCSAVSPSCLGRLPRQFWNMIGNVCT